MNFLRRFSSPFCSSRQEGAYTGQSVDFYSLSPEERRRMTAEAKRLKTTVMTRWENLKLEKTGDWLDRSRQAMSLLAGARSILDLGCGTMAIEPLLDSGIAYIPADVVRRDSRTIVVDLNKKEYPNVQVDAVLGLGIMEYVHDVPWLLKKIAASCSVAVLSYNVASAEADLAEREGHAWVNHFSEADIESLFASAGLTVVERQGAGGRQMLWKLRRN